MSCLANNSMKGEPSDFKLKYARILEILPSVADCAGERLILIGGTALAVFHLRHRLSVDLDFATNGNDDVSSKEKLKGCLSSKGVRAFRSRFSNQFVIQFSDTSIKVEILPPTFRVQTPEWHDLGGGTRMLVASIGDILCMKEHAYSERKEARDLFDLFCIMRANGGQADILPLIKKHGAPKNMERLEAMVFSRADFEEFNGLISDASKTGG